MSKYRRMTFIAVLAAMAYILMYISFPIIPIVPWLKIDFSDIVILFGMIMLGVKDGILIAVIEELIYLIVTGPSVGHLIGVGSNFIAMFCLCLPLYLTLKKTDFIVTVKQAVCAVGLEMLVLTSVMSLANFFVITPLYINVLGMKLGFSITKIVLLGVVPFNLIKGLVVGIAFLVMIHFLKPYFSHVKN
ncbi:ECF transporter S component [Ligilactobacillus cholophilus]|uniref:ECF transporter S component n=1 Tax=Ligilactobacillus cholophilus TaxID=3050131 RepID=UPI0025B09DB4|nr:ECF transporter S component [Ligilactobacillus cholophilus]